ncbi:MAG: hypothetical protein B6D38_10980 [Anaerolineae bacterium UTCFX1]|jgi:REP element-mobilizing transposase RayT|nr:MAG: hypothetical protein B6D38_10980 [Anaerolineae bacterium UTCFX1]
MKSKFDPQKHHRHSIRLKGYDYSSEGAYYVTIVAQGRECLFGEIVDGELKLNEAGEMVVRWWNELPNKFPNIVLGEFVVMPNHFHGIIFIMENVGADLRVCPDGEEKGEHVDSPKHADSPQRSTLSQMIQWFKTMTTNEYIRGVKQSNWKPFIGKVWQRNYYEHIIRNEKELQQKTNYILDNPSRWDEDDENFVK